MGACRHNRADKTHRVISRIIRISTDPSLISRTVSKSDYRWLYELLAERPSYACISHREMPTYDDHCAYWDMIRDRWETGIVCENGNTEVPVGYWYVTDRGEVGIHIKSEHRHMGYGTAVVSWIARTHKGRTLLANVAPGNTISRRMFKRLGWTLIQVTYSSP